MGNKEKRNLLKSVFHKMIVAVIAENWVFVKLLFAFIACVHNILTSMLQREMRIEVHAVPMHSGANAAINPSKFLNEIVIWRLFYFCDEFAFNLITKMLLQVFEC